MDYRKRIDRQSHYRQSLQKVGRERDPRDYFSDDVVSFFCGDADKFTFSVQIPLHDTFAFIVNNRLVLENIDYYMNQDSGPVLSPEELFDTLKPLLSDTANLYLRTIDCGISTMESIITSFSKNDKDTFTKIIQDNNLSLTRISNICNLLWSYVTIPQSLTVEEWHDYMDSLVVSDTQELDEEQQKLFESFNSLDEAADQWKTSNELDQYKVFAEGHDRFQQRHVEYLLNLYWDDPRLFTIQERRQIEEIVHRPAAKGIYDICRQRFDDRKNDEPFTLPEDFFTLKNESSYTDEFFTLRYEVVKAGPDKLTELINYLSDCSYISNSLLVKKMLAYRLSGKMRPERIVPIKWDGRNGKSYELIYLVKCLTERADYRKMKDFFTGPKWVANRDSSYARGADYHLKETLHKLYPTLPDQL